MNLITENWTPKSIRTDANQVSKTPSRRYKQRNASEESDGDAKRQIVVLTGKGALPKIPKECGKVAANVPEMS
jgi:hypothetical protein